MRGLVQKALVVSALALCVSLGSPASAKASLIGATVTCGVGSPWYCSTPTAMVDGDVEFTLANDLIWPFGPWFEVDIGDSTITVTSIGPNDISFSNAELTLSGLYWVGMDGKITSFTLEENVSGINFGAGNIVTSDHQRSSSTLIPQTRGGWVSMQ